jgi:hypothetical protein
MATSRRPWRWVALASGAVIAVGAMVAVMFVLSADDKVPDPLPVAVAVRIEPRSGWQDAPGDSDAVEKLAETAESDGNGELGSLLRFYSVSTHGLQQVVLTEGSSGAGVVHSYGVPAVTLDDDVARQVEEAKQQGVTLRPAKVQLDGYEAYMIRQSLSGNQISEEYWLDVRGERFSIDVVSDAEGVAIIRDAVVVS